MTPCTVCRGKGFHYVWDRVNGSHRMECFKCKGRKTEPSK